MTLRRGLYETLVTEALDAELSMLPKSLSFERSELESAEAADRVALHIARVVERALATQPDKDRVRVASALAREVVNLVVRTTDTSEFERERPVDPTAVLRTIRSLLPDGRPESIAGPLIPLLDTTLLTNAPGEPRVGTHALPGDVFASFAAAVA